MGKNDGNFMGGVVAKSKDLENRNNRNIEIGTQRRKKGNQSSLGSG